MKYRSRARYSCGFTLVEICVVIVVIAILVAILFPVIVKLGHFGGYHGNCLSNEKQLGLAMAQYAEDYDEALPCGTAPAQLQAIPEGWAGQIYPYVKSVGVFHCPADPGLPDAKSAYLVPVSYAYNWNVGNMGEPSLTTKKGNPGVYSASLNDFTGTSRTVLLCEVVGVTADVADTHGMEAASPTVLGGALVVTSRFDGDSTKLQYATGVLRSDAASAAKVGTDAGDAQAEGVHEGGSNFLLSDFHAVWLRPESVSAGLSNPFGSDDCTAGQGLAPTGKAGNGYAAGTACADPVLRATFSIN